MTAAPECQTCGAAGELEQVRSRSLAEGMERTEWFCADRRACFERRWPGLVDLLATGWPAAPAAEREVETSGPEIEPEAEP